MTQITDGHIRSAITGVANGTRAHITLRDPSERGGGRLRLEVRAGAGAPSAEWYIGYQYEGRRKSTKIGTYPTLSLAAARRTFRLQYQPDILEGRSPMGPRTWRRKGVAPTIEEMFEAYVANLEKKGAKTADRFRRELIGPAGVAEAVGRSRPAGSIQPEDLTPHLKVIYDRGSRDLAEWVRAATRAAFQHSLKSRHDVQAVGCGVDWGLKGNPCDSIPRIERSPPRRRALTPMEFRELWFWLEDKARSRRYYRLAKALQLMMLTGQRPSEILTLSAAQFDPIEGSLAWETTKNGRAHAVPLCRQAVQIMMELSPNEHGLFFARARTPREPALPDSANKYVQAFVRETGISTLQMRDLRRTWKSLAGDVGISKEACDRLQNHTYGDVAFRHYDHSDHWLIKTTGIDMWEAKVDLILFSAGDVSRRSLGRPDNVLLLAARVVEDDPPQLG